MANKAGLGKCVQRSIPGRLLVGPAMIYAHLDQSFTGRIVPGAVKRIEIDEGCDLVVNQQDDLTNDGGDHAFRDPGSEGTKRESTRAEHFG